MCFSNGHPIYWPADVNKQPDCINFFLAKGIARTQVEIKNYADLSSDHLPIIFQLSRPAILSKCYKHITNKYTDWDYFCEMLDEKIDLSYKISTSLVLEEAISTFTKIVQEAAITSTPTIKQTSKPTHSCTKVVQVAVRHI